MDTNKNILVTGASGFIGRHLVAALIKEPGSRVRALVRSPQSCPSSWLAHEVQVTAGDLLDPTSLRGSCQNIDTVFHLAGYAHAEDSDEERGVDLHRRITVEGTRALLSEAVAAGVRNFIFVSSVKALGEGGDLCLNEDSPAKPSSGYGKAKLEAERLAFNAGAANGMSVSVLRLPLVYGRDNKGNIPRMLAAVDRGRFPPIPEVHNKRSMVHVDDVVAALLAIARNPRMKDQIYIVTDGEAYSSRRMYEAICKALNKNVPRWSVPIGALRLGARLGDGMEKVFGRRAPLDTSTLEKLFGSAYYSAEKIKRDLNFHAQRTLEEALPEMVAEYRKTRSGL